MEKCRKKSNLNGGGSFVRSWKNVITAKLPDVHLLLKAEENWRKPKTEERGTKIRSKKSISCKTERCQKISRLSNKRQKQSEICFAWSLVISEYSSCWSLSLYSWFNPTILPFKVDTQCQKSELNSIRSLKNRRYRTSIEVIGFSKLASQLIAIFHSYSVFWSGFTKECNKGRLYWIFHWLWTMA